MKYEDMSNLLINKHVANILDLKESPVSGMTYGDGLIVYPHSNEVNFDPCNNPLDAWPIILGYNITIEMSFDCMFETYSFVNGKRYSCTFDEKELALRAAMICFLRMKDAE